MKGKEAIVNILKLEGVEFLSCFPYNPLIDAAAEAGIRPIVARTERTAVNMADGFSRISNGRRTGVCAMQSGPGIENAFGGVAQAYADSVPILLLPGHAGRHRLGLPPDFDAVQNYQGVTKWVARINSADRVPEMMRRAFTCLRTGRPGPVMLEVPRDVANSELDDSAFRYTPVKGAKPAGDARDVREVARALLAASSPLIHAGQGVLYACAWDELRELAELLQAPVMTTLAGKSAFAENHPLSIGVGAHVATRAAAHFLRQADLVFGIGCSFSMAWMYAPIPEGKVMIQATIDSRDINKEYSMDHVIVGDARLVLRQLIDEVKQRAGSSRRGNDAVAREIKAVKDEWLKEWMPKLTSDEVPINPYRVIWDLMQTVDRRRTIVTHDSGNPRDQMVPFYEAINPNGYIGWGKSTQLGYSLGLAMGAKLAAPDRLVVNVMGDAAFGMAGMDLETAVRERIPILTIVLNNSALGGYEKHIPVATERYGTKFLSGNYARVADGLGSYNERVEKPQDVVPAIQRAKEVVESGRPALVEMITREESGFSRF
jgi:thiamine pyrophosphate-dependent acetolactate synthase large subunit-like protein